MEGLTAFDTMKMLTVLKKEKACLYKINSQSLQHSLAQLDKAFKSFFKNNTAYPKFRSKKDNQYFIVPSGIRVSDNRLIIPKFQEGIKFRDKEGVLGNIK